MPPCSCRGRRGISLTRHRTPSTTLDDLIPHREQRAESRAETDIYFSVATTTTTTDLGVLLFTRGSRGLSPLRSEKLFGLPAAAFRLIWFTFFFFHTLLCLPLRLHPILHLLLSATRRCIVEQQLWASVSDFRKEATTLALIHRALKSDFFFHSDPYTLFYIDFTRFF